MDMTLASPTARAPAAADPADALAQRALTVARRTALGVLGDREAAADVAQEVALQVVLRRDALREPGALDAWVHRIAVRAALREAGRARRRRAAEEARVALRGDGPPDDDLGGALALLDGLPPRQRAALTLRYVHDLPDDAIARALRCRAGTVRSLLSRGRDAVRARLDEDPR
jgi:RNA polymerase sigma factor (sigma-70 family)